MSNSKIIVITNQKGGVDKTTMIFVHYLILIITKH